MSEYASTPGALQSWEQDRRTLEATFERGKLRLTSFAKGIIRVHFSATGDFAPRRSWAVTAQEGAFDGSAWEVEEGENGLLLSADDLSVRLARDGTLACERGDETFAEDAQPFSWREVGVQDTNIQARDRDELPEGRARLEVRTLKMLPPGDAVYGLGERTGKLERRGRVFTNWNVDAEWGLGRHQDNLYQSHPICLVVRPGLAWGTFLDSSFYSRFDVGYGDPERLGVRTLGGELDLYLLLGPTPTEVVQQLTKLTGRPLMPPLWALGYHQSRWGYRSAEEMRQLARRFRAADTPLDAIHFDIDYMRGYRDFTWHPEHFPEPGQLLNDLRETGVRAVTILDPGVKDELEAQPERYEAAERGAQKDVFIKNSDGSRFSGYCWPGKALFPDYTKGEVRAWWGDELKRSHLDVGVAGVWVDMNEPAIFDAPFDSENQPVQAPMPLGTPQGGDESVTHAEVHNLYGHLMARATFEGLLAHRPDERPWVLTRSAFAGTQRYAASWTGDNSSWWEHLEMSLPQLSSLGLVGSPWVGADIGGFTGHADPELYARWIELGTFYPFMRTHNYQSTRAQEPWSFGDEVEEIVQRAIKLRYRLLPYLYTLAHHAHNEGTPIYRPLVYDFPNDRKVYQLDDQIMVGPHLLIAPVYRPGQDRRMVYLPEGVWYDLWSGERVAAGYHIAHAPLGRIPTFVRGGAILPMGNERNSTTEPLSELTLHIYPSGKSAWTVLEDDGLSFDYQKGAVARLRVEVSEGDSHLKISIEPDYSAFEPALRTLALQLHLADVPQRVILNGEEVGAKWDEAGHAVSLFWQDDGGAREVIVSI